MTIDTIPLERAIRAADRIGPRLRLSFGVTTHRNIRAMALRLSVMLIISATCAAIALTIAVHGWERWPLLGVALAMPAVTYWDRKRVVEADDVGIRWLGRRRYAIVWNDIRSIDCSRGQVVILPTSGDPIPLVPLSTRLPGPFRRATAQAAASLAEELARARARHMLSEPT